MRNSRRSTASKRLRAVLLHVSACWGALPRASGSSSESIHEAHSNSPDGEIRRNRILRRVTSARTGRVIEERVIAENQRRVLSTAEQGRTCLTCGEEACVRREGHLRGVG